MLQVSLPAPGCAGAHCSGRVPAGQGAQRPSAPTDYCRGRTPVSTEIQASTGVGEEPAPEPRPEREGRVVRGQVWLGQPAGWGKRGGGG